MNRYLIHYNHNHDRLGRFTSGPGGAPNDSTILKKGMRLNSVSPYDAEARRKVSIAPMYTYNPDDKWDSDVYKGAYSKYMRMYRGATFVNENKYKVIKDLKMPTREQRVEEFKNLYNSKEYNKQIIKELKPIQKALADHDIGSTNQMKTNIKTLNLKKLKTDSDWETAYEIFGHAMEAQHRFKSTSEYTRRMSEKYDAMVDDNNQGIYNGSHDPIIVFRTDQVLKTVGSQRLSDSEMQVSYERVKRELAKRGENVKV